MPPTIAAAEIPAVMMPGIRRRPLVGAWMRCPSEGPTWQLSMLSPLIANRIAARGAGRDARADQRPAEPAVRVLGFWGVGRAVSTRGTAPGGGLRGHCGHRGRREVGVQGRDAVEQGVGGGLDVVDHLLGRADVALGDGVVFAVAGDVPDPQLDVVAAHVVAAPGGEQHVTGPGVSPQRPSGIRDRRTSRPRAPGRSRAW